MGMYTCDIALWELGFSGYGLKMVQLQWSAETVQLSLARVQQVWKT